MIKFLTVLAFIIFGFYFAGLVIRAVFSRWLRRKTEEFNRAAQAAQKEAARRGRREGEVIVENTRPEAAKKVAGGVGEYVDFEEITVKEDK
jgi:flagellar biosynthesis/type III secretory pathway M-ring protein FliF/YscJ